MVSISEIHKSNASFAARSHHGLVCVFAGATAGIGAATLRELVGLMHSSTFYVFGRTPSRYHDRLDELKKIGLTNEIVFVDTQISLISKIDDACKLIATAEGKVDIIFASPGGMPFQGAICTSQPIILTIAISDVGVKIQKKASSHASLSLTTPACASSPISCLSSPFRQPTGAVHPQRHKREAHQGGRRRPREELGHCSCREPHHSLNQFGLQLSRRKR